jgi:hypothetical protein
VDLTPATEYFFRIRAVNSAGASPHSAEIRATTHAAPPIVQSSATFVTVDASTSGLWPFHYGGDGTALAGQQTSLPSGINLNVSSSGEVVWEENSEDPRSLINTTGTGRIAAGWRGTPLNLDLNIPRGTPRKVALYFLDWNRTGASQQITIRDAATGSDLHTHTLADLGDGQYLVYNIEGHVNISIVAQNGEALLSGVLFGGGVPAPISDRPLTFTILGHSPDALRVRIAGDSGQRFKIQSTADFRTWSDVIQSILLGSSTDLTLPKTAPGANFFRTQNTR